MSDRIRTVDMSDPAVVLDCYRKLNVAYKELKAENEKLRAALKPFADVADDIEHGDKDSYNLWEHPAAMSITIGDLRNCQRILDGSTIE